MSWLSSQGALSEVVDGQADAGTTPPHASRPAPSASALRSSLTGEQEDGQGRHLAYERPAR